MQASENRDLRKSMESSSSREQMKIDLMRILVEKQDPFSKEADDLTLRRFLRARDLDVEKASAMFLKYLKWRRTFVPKGSISVTEVPEDIAQNKMFLQGVDKQSRPVAIVLGARHFQNKKGGLDEFKRFVVYGLDKISAKMPPGQEKFVAIGDLQGWGYANTDLRGYLGALSILQIIFVENKSLKQTLLEDIDESQLPEIYGGKLPLVPIQDS